MRDFTTNQRKVLAALLTEPSIPKAAKKSGLCVNTVYGYLKQPSFKAELRGLQDRTINAATAALSGLTGTALGVLQDTLNDKSATGATRVRAALGILDSLVKISTFADLEERIAALEQATQDV